MIVLASAASAGGWTQPAGDCYVKAGYRVVPGVPGATGFGPDGERVDLAPYADHALQFYGEVGLTNTWTAVVTATPLGLGVYDGERAMFVGPSRVGIRRALTRGPVHTAIELQVGGTPPVGDRDLAPEADVVWQPAVPTAQASLAAQVGYGFGRNWLSAEIGFRAASALQEVGFGSLQVGRQWEHLVLDLHVPVVWTLQPLEEPLNYMGSGDTRYVGLGIGIGWWFSPRVGLATGLEGVATARANAASLTLPVHLQLR